MGEIPEHVRAGTNGERRIGLQQVTKTQVGHVRGTGLEALDHLGVGRADLALREDVQPIAAGGALADLLRSPEQLTVVGSGCRQDMSENDGFRRGAQDRRQPGDARQQQGNDRDRVMVHWLLTRW